VTAGFVEPRLQRSLAAVYRFYDAFLYPIDDGTPPIASPLDVLIPQFGWAALAVASDHTYRFSASTLTGPAPAGVNLAVTVTAANGEYVSLEPIALSLPLPLSTPPTRADFLTARPLWPTPALRPPAGETAIRGFIRSATAQPVADLQVEIWTGSAPLPPAGTPFTRSDAKGDFVFRFPRLKGPPGDAVPVSIRLSGGAVTVVPASLSIVLGQTQTVAFQRP
jgi:hypothetical protein